MKILLLADPQSIHTIRWATALAKRGLSVHIFGLNPYRQNDYLNTGINVYSANIKPSGIKNKLMYVSAIFRLKKFIREIRPDIVHAHYASSYGMLGNLCGFRPLIISVWGSDVFDFPKRSVFHKRILEYNLSSANLILSTSMAMADEALKYVKHKPIEITPFGIDVELFKPRSSPTENSVIRIGTIKTLSRIYGIDTLLRAFALVKKKTRKVLTLTIAGEGEEKNNLIKLANELSIADSVTFVGKIAHHEVPELLNKLAIFCALSLEESFGVAILEASACGIPVVVSDAVGLKEVVEHGVTGIVVAKNNPHDAAGALYKLIESESLCRDLGKAGRDRVEKMYNWQLNVDTLVRHYREILESMK